MITSIIIIIIIMRPAGGPQQSGCTWAPGGSGTFGHLKI